MCFNCCQSPNPFPNSARHAKCVNFQIKALWFLWPSSRHNSLDTFAAAKWPAANDIGCNRKCATEKLANEILIALIILLLVNWPKCTKTLLANCLPCCWNIFNKLVKSNKR